jgi:DNA polymerase III delta' subunit
MAFTDIAAQEIPKRILQSQIETDRIGNAYLFFGPEGVGKTLAAKTFAKAINCEESENDSCDKCRTCKQIDELNSPDFFLVTAEKGKSIGIGQIRAIEANVSYRTTWLKFRVILIKGAETLTHEASNAFLKTLEESPLRTVFVLTTSRIDAILPTVKSRCQQVEFKRLKESELKDLIPDATESVLRLANGSVSRALQFMEPAFEELRHTTLEFLTSSSTQRVQLAPKSTDMQSFLTLIQELFMDLLRKNVDAPELVKNSDLELSKPIPVLEILRALTVCEKAFYALTHNVNKRLILYWISKELP